MNEQEIYINLLTQIELVMRIALFAILSIGASVWTHIQWMKYTNIRDTVRRQKILDDINRGIAESNLKQTDINIGPTHTHPMQLPTNVTPITRKYGDGIWEPNKR